MHVWQRERWAHGRKRSRAPQPPTLSRSWEQAPIPALPSRTPGPHPTDKQHNTTNTGGRAGNTTQQAQHNTTSGDAEGSSKTRSGATRSTCSQVSAKVLHRQLFLVYGRAHLHRYRCICDRPVVSTLNAPHYSSSAATLGRVALRYAQLSGSCAYGLLG